MKKIGFLSMMLAAGCIVLSNVEAEAGWRPSLPVGVGLSSTEAGRLGTPSETIPLAQSTDC